MLYLVYHAHVGPLTLLSEIGDCADFSVRSAVAAYLARPGEAQTSKPLARSSLECPARAANKANAPDSNSPASSGNCRILLIPCGHASARSGCFRRARSHPLRGVAAEVSLASILLELLSQPEFSSDAAQALAKLGDQAVGLLERRLAIPLLPLTAGGRFRPFS